MKRMLSLRWLLVLLLLSCSGGLVSGPAAENSPAQGQAGGLSPIGTKPGPAVAQAAPGPGSEEVLLGPTAADPNQESDRMITCELSCGSFPLLLPGAPPKNQAGIQVKAKLQLMNGLVGNRIIRIVEYFVSEEVTSFEDLKTDAQGNFNFVISGPEKRTVRVFLPQLKDETTPLDKMLPCPEDICMQEGAGNLVKLNGVLMTGVCNDLTNVYGIDGEDCQSLLKVDLKNIHPILVNSPANPSQP